MHSRTVADFIIGCGQTVCGHYDLRCWNRVKCSMWVPLSLRPSLLPAKSMARPSLLILCGPCGDQCQLSRASMLRVRRLN